MKERKFVAVAACAALSACGGASTTTNTLPDVLTFEDIIALAAPAGPLEGTNFEDPDTYQGTLPGGTATYTGYAAVFYDSDYTGATSYEPDYYAIGAAEMDVDFDAGTAVAEASDFHEITVVGARADLSDWDGEPIAGSATFDYTRSTMNPNIYEGRVTGSLTTLTGDTITIDVPSGGGFGGDTGEWFWSEGFDDTSKEAAGVFVFRQ